MNRGKNAPFLHKNKKIVTIMLNYNFKINE